MSHSEKPLNPTLLKLLNEDLALQAQALHLGRTGTIETDKFCDDDQGELNFALATFRGRVVINFGDPVSWLAMTPDHALELSMQIASLARKAKHEIRTRKEG